jgi:predicted enzyme related to lactoylglutathione lyase
MSIDKGRFTWFEHLSADTAAAQRFYTEVLPWKVEAVPMPGKSYSMIKAGDAMLGGFADLPKPGLAPHWISYLSVDDVDASAKRVVAAGGRTLMDAFDVPTVGRMQPIADPFGAALFLFRSAEGEPPAPTGPGTFNWNELWCKDAAGALAFYEKALGFTHDAMDMPQGKYYVLKTGDKHRGGIMEAPAAETHWLPYVEVADLDGTLGRAVRNGGTQEGDALHLEGIGRFAFVRDPQGARLGLITPERAG